jgi:hypothetical protein
MECDAARGDALYTPQDLLRCACCVFGTAALHVRPSLALIRPAQGFAGMFVSPCCAGGHVAQFVFCIWIMSMIKFYSSDVLAFLLQASRYLWTTRSQPWAASAPAPPVRKAKQPRPEGGWQASSSAFHFFAARLAGLSFVMNGRCLLLAS